MVKRKCFVFEPGSLHIARICLKMGENIFFKQYFLRNFSNYDLVQRAYSSEQI